MKTSLETISTLERKLNIEVPAEAVQAAFDRAFQGLQKHATIKGFRKGKAPLNTIKSIYGDRVKEDVIQDIVQSHYASALKEHSLSPITYPAIEFDPIESGKSFSFSAEFEVRPEVKLQKIEGLSVKKEKFEVTEALVNETLESIRTNRRETSPILEDRAAQKGDVAVIDFKGFVGGEELEGGSSEGHELELGSNSFIAGFEDGIIGMRVGGNTRLKLSFPAEYHVEKLAGKPVEFDVVLKELKQNILPELNDEFAKGLGPYENLEALKKAIRDDFEAREGKRINDELKERIMQALIDANPVVVPKALLADQKKALIEDLEKRMRQQQMTGEQLEEYKQKWDADFEKTAAHMIQGGFLINKIAEEQGLSATDEDVSKRLAAYILQTGIEAKRIDEFYNDKERRSRLSYQITEEKVLDWLLSKANVEEVSRDQIKSSEEN